MMAFADKRDRAWHDVLLKTWDRLREAGCGKQ